MAITVHMIGNSHLDPIWGWDWEVGADEAIATFRSAADRCTEYEAFHFTAGEAWRYAAVEHRDPDLFERIRGLITAGRWHVVGGQWVQPDCNLPSQPGWRQQFDAGNGYFEETFGVTPQIGWNLDSWGHPATLPQLLVEFGIKAYVFGRGRLDDSFQTFRWLGSDGSEVIGHRVEQMSHETRHGHSSRHPSYSGTEYSLEAKLSSLKPVAGHAMCFYGIGNHGGGPTKRVIEWIIDHQNSVPGLELRLSHPEAFFDAISHARAELPLVAHELQHVGIGSYSAMHVVKRRQRILEWQLQGAERLVEQRASGGDATVLTPKLRNAYRDVAFTQFHDILAGCSVAEVWDSVASFQGRALLTSREVAYRVTRKWARSLAPVDKQQILFVNQAGIEWEGLAQHEPWIDGALWGERWLSELDGSPVDHQVIQSGMPFSTRLLIPLRLDVGAHQQLVVRNDSRPPRIDTDLSAAPRRLANSSLKVDLRENGIGPVRYLDRSVLNSWTFLLREDPLDCEVWSGTTFDGAVLESLTGLEWSVEERGPLRVQARAEGWLGRSRLHLAVSLERNRPWLDVQLRIIFGEQHRVLQMETKLANRVTSRLDGLAGGAVAREVDNQEWPVQGWSRLTTDQVAAAIVTQDAYSLSVSSEGWRWTLLRAPYMAAIPYVVPGWTETRGVFTDQGEHEFTFRLVFGEALSESDLSSHAERLALSPIGFDRYEGLDRSGRAVNGGH
jgi:alpha-mannosidase